MGLFSAKRMPPPSDLQTVYVGAPIGGINSVDLATQMPPGDSVYAWNMVPAEYGLRARLGYSEWFTGLGGAAGFEVRTLLPFTGTQKTGSTNKLFAAMEDGLYDVSASGSSPSLVTSFGTTTGEAGNGVFTMATTPAGRFGVYTDEENGLYEYSESGAAMSKIALGVNAPWPGSILATAVLVGNKVLANGNSYNCITAGVTAGTGTGPSGTGQNITDGTAHWAYLQGPWVQNTAYALGVNCIANGKVYTCTVAGTSALTGSGPSVSSGTTADGSVTWSFVSVFANTIGPSLADQQNGYTGDPANFAAVCIWKNRMFLVEKNTTRAWYLAVNAVTGVATSFDFGSKFKQGGPLVNLYNWSYNGGSGMATSLVAISSAGDVSVYDGTDPTTAATFGITGTWSIGAVPYGRHIATDFGGDILVLTLIGVVPLSKLVTGKTVVGESDDSKSVYDTGKIGNLFNQLAYSASSLPGWALHVHPTDNTLLVLAPTTAGQPTQQLAMDFATKGWGRYRDLPMRSAAIWNGKLYFGTTDGRVCLNDGYLDNVLLSTGAFTPVNWSVLTAYENMGNANAKKVELILPEMESQGNIPIVAAQALYDLSFIEPAPPAGTVIGTGSTWDNGKWDTAIWGGDYVASSKLQGGTGVGRSVAIAARGQAIARTVLTGFHVFYRVGGPL